MKLVKKIKIYPTKSQKETFDFWIRRCHILYNVAIEEKISYYNITGKYLNKYEQKKELVSIKDLDKSWNDIPNKSLADVIFTVDKAFQNFFRGKGFPKYKSQKDFNSIYFIRDEVRIKESKLYLPKIKDPIKFKESIPLNYSSIRLVRDNKDYYLCFTYSKETKDIINSNEVLGIDLGLKSLYTDSNNVSVNRFSVKLVKKYRKRIEVLNRSLSKKTKGSNRFNKVKKNLNKTYKGLSNSNNDYLHKKSIELVKKSNDILVVGDIKIQKIIDKSNKGLIKSFYSSSLGKFKEMIKYKCQLNGRQVYFINEAYTSKTCSCCGNIKKDLKLNDRVYSCNNCQNNIDRDFNAAINIKLLGLSIISKEMVVH